MTGSVSGVSTYTQGASGGLVLQVSSSSSASVSATTITLDGALVISPQGSGFGLVQPLGTLAAVRVGNR